jgi:hypothetical protein
VTRVPEPTAEQLAVVDNWTLAGRCISLTKRRRPCPWVGPWPCQYHDQQRFYRVRKMVRAGQAAICECDQVIVAGRDHFCSGLVGDGA